MATANRYITTSDITHVEVLVNDQDIKVTSHEGGRRCLQLGPLYVYLDTDGITRLLELLLDEPEVDRPEVFRALMTAAAVPVHTAKAV
jgi:hypothetical protein